MIRKLAFRVGEYALVAEVDVLHRLQERFSDRTMVVPNMAQYSGRHVRIRNADEIMGYEFVEVEGRWMEGSIADPNFHRASQNPAWYARASDIYYAVVSASNKQFVEVRDQRDLLHLSFRSNTPQRDVEALNHIASMRCRISFEHNHGFDGEYNGEERRGVLTQ